ncbi:MAG: hypothetical protein LBR26_07750 [Prevotella sp.]|jgi:hypothetical protein|nr:hypothetical protein [Prevotella sp.]
MDKPNTSQGNPPDKIPVYESLLDFVDNALFLFKPFTKDINGHLVTAEDLIIQDFEKILNDKARKNNESFAFQNQHKEGRYSTDISVYKTSSYEDFCWIEAKRLPTPDAGIKRDEREYVFVSNEKINGENKYKGNGGIQRFKENKHAPNLLFSIMIGYIQENDSDYWLDKINAWIKQLVVEDSTFWNEKDCLRKQESQKSDRYKSIHNRKNKLNPIILHHFWIKL